MKRDRPRVFVKVCGINISGVHWYASKRPGYICCHHLPDHLGHHRVLRVYPDHGVTIAFQINTDSGVLASDKNVPGSIAACLIKN